MSDPNPNVPAPLGDGRHVPEEGYSPLSVPFPQPRFSARLGWPQGKRSTAPAGERGRELCACPRKHSAYCQKGDRGRKQAPFPEIAEWSETCASAAACLWVSEGWLWGENPAEAAAAAEHSPSRLERDPHQGNDGPVLLRDEILITFCQFAGPWR